MDTLKNYHQYKTFKKLNESVSGSVRVRFAPSPTGALHIGGVRTALYNYLFAKKYNGKFILRIEDTDSSRFVSGAEQYIIDSFNWLGIEFDEGPHIGGSYGPYRQSERRDIYIKYAQQLVDDGKAYYAFDTPEEMDIARKDIPNFAYDAKTRMKMKNSLTLPKEEVDYLIKNTDNWVIRIKYPDNPFTITVQDLIRGTVNVNSSTLDDKVIWKRADELPTYHLANIVDDHLMKITHVIRGEEWLPSAPLHVFLYQSFGWNSPEFAHLPLIMKPEGSGKLSKRDGDMGGFPVFPLKWTDPKGDISKNSSGYKDQGYTPSALINILAFLGWNPGTNKEVYTLDDLIKDFSLERVNKAGARFNPNKAKWFNGQHLKMTDSKLLLDDFKKILEDKGIYKDDNFILKVLDDNKGKVNFIKDLYDEVNYLFQPPTEFDQKVLKKWTQEAAILIDGLAKEFEKLNTWYSKNIQDIFEQYVKDNKIRFSDIAPSLRLLLTGKANGPSLFDIMEMIGKDETISRLLTDKLPVTTDYVKTEQPVNNQNKQQVEMLTKEIDGIKKSLKSSESKLSNKNFVDRAPSDVVEKEKQKVEELKIKLLELEQQLSNL